MILSLLLLGLTPSAESQAVVPAETEAPRARTLPSDLRDYFSGRWRGSGRFERTGKPVESIFTFQSVAEGEALAITHEERPPNNFRYEALLSVDTSQGEVTMFVAGNRGTGARLLRSRGWEGDRLVFVTDQALRSWFGYERITFIRLDRAQFSVRYETSRDGAVWGGGDTQLYTRVD